MIIGIDATNLRIGGGVTHIKNLLISMDRIRKRSLKVFIWSNQKLLDEINDYSWLEKSIFLHKNKFFKRFFWQYFILSKKAKLHKCDVLLIPGGSYIGNFSPTVIMSRNMLPFEYSELSRYGFSFMTIRLLMLRFVQKTSFRRANGLIFLSNYAKDKVLKVLGDYDLKTKIIPHGVNKIFYQKVKKQKPINSFSVTSPFRLIYVSIIDVYKHQCSVAKAISIIRKKSIPVTIDFIGPSYKPSLKKFNKKVTLLDPDKEFLNYLGKVDYNLLPQYYRKSDMALFASSCENMPNILLEMMASGLPIACSNRGPMPEIYGSRGYYFDPEDPEEIAEIILKLILNVDKRQKLSKHSSERAKLFNWGKTTSETLSFMEYFIEPYKYKM